MADVGIKRRLTNQEEIIYLLSVAIASSQRACASERNSPSHTADAMDDYIKSTRDDVKKLRRIREELETIFYGEIG